MPPLIHWFRRDLRLFDNTALAAAIHDSGGAVIPLFILDDALLRGRRASPARTAFLLDSLRALDHTLGELGSRLIVRRGDALGELLALLRSCNASGVYWNRDYTPYAIRRDTAVKTALQAAGFAARSFKDAVVFEMNEVLTEQSRPYTVYTPYSRRWRARLAESGCRLVAAPQALNNDEILRSSRPVTIPALADLGMAIGQELPAAGEAAGRALLRRFVDLQQDYAIGGYTEGRDQPALPATSRLSPHLRLGTVSVRECLRRALDCRDQQPDQQVQRAIDSWIGELIWRDFYVQVLYHHPHVLRGAFKPLYNRIAWQNDEALFAAWQTGRTGYPIVDAAMRQLAREAWMHNRARMIVASFLSKDLLIDWRWGEAHFMHLLVDGDPAANNGGWQWAAGTGTDAQPYFRIFNPTSQGRKFDPAGAYVRRYLPELAGVPDRFVHEPWKMPEPLQRQCGLQLGHDYPYPLVDHAARRQEALAIYRAASDDPDGVATDVK